MGEPNRVALEGSTILAPGRQLAMGSEISGLAQMISDFTLFKCSPIFAPSRSITSRSHLGLSTFPPRVPSSKLNRASLDSSCVIMCWMLRQKRSGPKGSPCCTPSAEWIVLSIQKPNDEVQLQDRFIRVRVLQVEHYCMHSCLCASLHSKNKLSWG